MTVVRETPAVSLYFVSYEFCLRLFHNTHEQQHFWHLLLAGGFAGGVSWVCTYPLDVIKTRYQADEQYKNATDCLKKTFQREGGRALWRGLGVTLLRFDFKLFSKKVLVYFFQYFLT